MWFKMLDNDSNLSLAPAEVWGLLAYDYTPVADRLAETLTLPGGSPLVT
jgi:hypothetical protein